MIVLTHDLFNNRLFLAAKNGVVYELWKNIGTNFISKLKEDSRFPSNPDQVEILRNFESAKNFANNYGARLRTYYRVRIFVYSPGNVSRNVDKKLSVSFFHSGSIEWILYFLPGWG